MEKDTRPVPNPGPISKTYWEKAAQGQLWLQQCSHCQSFVFYPRAVCPYCMSSALEWKCTTGKGKVYTFTVVNRTDLPGFREKLPYIYAIVELDEGPRMSANIVNCEIEKVYIDMLVEVVFEKLGSEINLPQFQPRTQ